MHGATEKLSYPKNEKVSTKNDQPICGPTGLRSLTYTHPSKNKSYASSQLLVSQEKRSTPGGMLRHIHRHTYTYILYTYIYIHITYIIYNKHIYIYTFAKCQLTWAIVPNGFNQQLGSTVV